jgi:hypothetical protein
MREQIKISWLSLNTSSVGSRGVEREEGQLELLYIHVR